MSTLKTPFKYDFVGSFLRPQELKDAKAKFASGEISKADYDKVVNDEITKLVAKDVYKRQPYNLIKKVMPDVLVKGGDYNIENIVGADIVKQKGGLVTTIAFVDGKSTTGIINKIKE